MSEELLSPLATFLLGVAALLNSILIFGNRTKSEVSEIEGKTLDEVEGEIQEALKRDPKSAIIEQYGNCLNVGLEFLYTFVVYPLLVITALTRNIGYQLISYTMLIFVGISWLVVIRDISLAITASKMGRIDKSEMERISPSPWTSLADQLNLSERARYWIRRIFVVLPVLYLWYLLLVVVGIIH